MEWTRSRAAVAWLAAAFLFAEGSAAALVFLPPTSNVMLAASLAVQGVWICLAFGIATLSSRSPADRLGLGPGRLRATTLMVLILGFIALSNGLSTLLAGLDLRNQGALAEIDATVASAQGPFFGLALLAVGVAPGIGEEILFRGLIQRGLTPRLGGAIGILLASAIFGLAHFDPVHSSTTFVMGLYLGSVAYLAGSVRAAMACHAVNNTLAVLAPRFGVPALAGSTAALVVALMATALLTLLWALWREGAAPLEAPFAAPSEPSAATPPGAPRERATDPQPGTQPRRSGSPL